MAAYCEMSPTALMMVHCVSTYAAGNHSSLEHTAEVLRTADRALCSAYMDKSGMSQEENGLRPGFPAHHGIARPRVPPEVHVSDKSTPEIQ